MTPQVARLYREFRGNMKRPAEEALASARQHVHFLKRLDDMVSEGKRRSRAGRKAAQKRRASR